MHIRRLGIADAGAMTGVAGRILDISCRRRRPGRLVEEILGILGLRLVGAVPENRRSVRGVNEVLVVGVEGIIRRRHLDADRCASASG